MGEVFEEIRRDGEGRTKRRGAAVSGENKRREEEGDLGEDGRRGEMSEGAEGGERKRSTDQTRNSKTGVGGQTRVDPKSVESVEL